MGNWAAAGGSRKSWDALRKKNEREAKDVALWSKKVREATARRDEAIRALRADGVSLREIARRAGLSHTAIANICASGFHSPEG